MNKLNKLEICKRGILSILNEFNCVIEIDESKNDHFLGWLRDEDTNEIVSIEKNKPKWCKKNIIKRIKMIKKDE